jgi:phosphoglycolate phosphatase
MTEIPRSPPRALLFDWHGTLVDTADAMFSAMAEMLPLLDELGLVERLLPEERCKSPDDARLVRFIRIFRQLHPRILAERRVSRTEIFNAIFGEDRDARRIAHAAYNDCYRHYFGQVKPFQQGIREYLAALRGLGIKVAVATNRSREFLDHELQLVDDGAWADLIETTICADDVTAYKPDPEMLHAALTTLGEAPGPDVWYVGDSYIDMVTARNAGIGAIYYNGARWEPEWLAQRFPAAARESPDAIVDSFDQLMDLLDAIQQRVPRAFSKSVSALRPPRYPAPEPPPPRIEPDWHPAVARLTAPRVLLFDWHATLVDTLDAMYRAMDDTLPELNALGLLDKMVDPADSRSPDDAKLVLYVQSFNRLHPKIRADRKISRTDIFEVLFGNDEETKQRAHRIFTKHYRAHFGDVQPFEPKVRDVLVALRRLGLATAVITNRDREFFLHELAVVDRTGWTDLFDALVCGDDTPLRKPHPEQLLLAIDMLGQRAAADVWYVGDSTTDIVAAKRAGITGVFLTVRSGICRGCRKFFPVTVGIRTSRTSWSTIFRSSGRWCWRRSRPCRRS